jgi:SAM-dependent methyltransferase
VCWHVSSTCLGHSVGRIADIGCGEGYTAKYFHERGAEVFAADFSRHGIETHNPDILNHISFAQCDIVNDNYFFGECFDLLILRNVLEHVSDPLLLLNKVKRMMHENSMLIIQVPNDVNNPLLERYMKRENLRFEECKFYSPPEHLRYFSFHSLRDLMNSVGFRQQKAMGDFPIELFLLNQNTNYYSNSFGKTAHSLRCEFSSVLRDQNIADVVNLCEALGKLCMGRDIIGFYKLCQNQ